MSSNICLALSNCPISGSTSSCSCGTHILLNTDDNEFCNVAMVVSTSSLTQVRVLVTSISVTFDPAYIFATNEAALSLEERGLKPSEGSAMFSSRVVSMVPVDSVNVGMV